MRLSTCLLIAAYLSCRVSAFYPYSFNAEDSSDEAEALLDSVRSGNDSGHTLTLDVTKVPVKRDNNHKIIEANKPSAPNTVALHQDGKDFSYFATVEIGSEGQEMWMLLDTGGTNTWVFGSDCTSEACKQHRTFDESSETFEKSDHKWDVSYGTGTVRGVLGNDTISIAGSDVKMTFGIASKASNDLISYPMDGILGLSRTNDSGFGAPTFMDALENSGQLKSNIISFRLSRAEDGGKDGQVTLGGVDKDKFTGDITYSSTVDDSDRWEIALDDASVNGIPCNFTKKSAVIDTGTSYVLIPPDDAKTLHSLIPGSKKSGSNFEIPCDSKANITFVFSGVEYNISPKDYINHVSDSKCVSTIAGQQLFGKDEWLVGATFLKNVYTVFDFDKNRIGFAELGSHSDSEDETQEFANNSTTSSSSGSSGSSSSTTGTTTASGAASTSTDDDSSPGRAIVELIPRFCWPAVVVMLGVLSF